MLLPKHKQILLYALLINTNLIIYDFINTYQYQYQYTKSTVQYIGAKNVQTIAMNSNGICQ
jgi:hypothetical protein